MERISEVITKTYQKYSPILRKLNISLDIDFPDTTLTIENKSRVEQSLDKSMRSAIKRSKNGRITIAVKSGKIILSDDGTILSKDACDLLSSEHVKVKSRVGFGTTVIID